MITTGYMLLDPEDKIMWWVTNIQVHCYAGNINSFDHPIWDDLLGADPEHIWRPIDDWIDKLQEDYSIEERVEFGSEWWDAGRKGAIVLYRLMGYHVTPVILNFVELP